jgi:hypothetical protein
MIPGMANIPAPMVAPMPSAVSMTQPRCLGVSSAPAATAGVQRINDVIKGMYVNP